jgi:hypothetical protein
VSILPNDYSKLAWDARKFKDVMLKMFKEVGLRRKVLEEIGDYMLSMCEEVEDLSKSKLKGSKVGE